jgi:hypothetical protein
MIVSVKPEETVRVLEFPLILRVATELVSNPVAAIFAIVEVGVGGATNALTGLILSRVFVKQTFPKRWGNQLSSHPVRRGLSGGGQ